MFILILIYIRYITIAKWNLSLNRRFWNHSLNLWFGYGSIAAVYIRVAITHYGSICNEMMWCEHNATAKTMIKFIIFVSSIVLSIWVVSVKQELPFVLGLAYYGFILFSTVFCRGTSFRIWKILYISRNDKG